MKKILALLILWAVAGCEPKHSVQRPAAKVNTPKPAAPAVIRQTETEYEQLMKTHKPETAKVLQDLLNGSEGSPETSISVENNSACNMVLTVSGPNFFKKIPIPSGKIGSTMVPKNQKYNLSGMVCKAVYQNTKFVSTSYSITITN
ncbi:competence protein ComL [Chryseobacterium sp. Leaf404]|uniref:DUF6759 domain-containing protein n=1 Tax=unclassified Chryseobacterium TaxID=2593645 RepID=UPI0006F1F68A|nr:MULTISPECIES: DUF6759 domain-containing protein [unclassified Chryseobacterium]KQT19259.1 competence protein ComL [Chryseobacterium sp. Leaf404]